MLFNYRFLLSLALPQEAACGLLCQKACVFPHPRKLLLVFYLQSKQYKPVLAEVDKGIVCSTGRRPFGTSWDKETRMLFNYGILVSLALPQEAACGFLCQKACVFPHPRKLLLVFYLQSKQYKHVKLAQLDKDFVSEALVSQPTQSWSREEVADWIRQKSITVEALSELSELNRHALLALKEEDLLELPGMKKLACFSTTEC